MAYSTVRDRIVAGTYPPGRRLVLGSLAAELRISPVPVREAIRRLEAETLVSFTRNVGATVRSLDQQGQQWALETLAIVEGAATGLAARFLTGDAFAEARAVNEQMRAGLAGPGPDLQARLDRRFHRVVSALCPNPELVRLVDQGWSRMAPLRTTAPGSAPDRTRGWVQEHDVVLAAIAAGAPAGEVEALIRAHLLTTLPDLVDRSADTRDGAPLRRS